MGDSATLFIVGVAAGIALHRIVMYLVLEYGPDNHCANCRWNFLMKYGHKRK